MYSKQEQNKRSAFLYIEKLKSSVNNSYCLYCRTEIGKNHHCSQIEKIGDKILEIYFQLDDERKKEIIAELKCELLIDEEFSENIRNKILAYSL